MRVYYQLHYTSRKGHRGTLGYPYAPKDGNPFDEHWRKHHGSQITAVVLQPDEAQELLSMWGQPYVE